MIRVMLLALGLVLTMPPATLAQDRYAEMVDAATRDPRAEVDYPALREAYVLSPLYTGQSSLKNLRAAAMLNKTSGPTDAEVIEAQKRDFALIDAQFDVYVHFKRSSHKHREALQKWTATHIRGLRDAILATERQVDGVRAFTVLSVGEEYVMLSLLEQVSTQQSLTEVGGVPFDRHETSQGPILFDISAFFGKY